MAAEESSEEATIVTAIGNAMDQFPGLIEQHRWQDMADLILKANWDAEWIINHYSFNHPTADNSQEFVDIKNHIPIQHIMLYDIIWVIGPYIFFSSDDVDWSFLSTSLNIETDKLQTGFINLNGKFQSNDIERVVRMILRAGTVHDYDHGGLALLSFTMCFLFLQESRHGPYEHLAHEFYARLQDYSFSLLVSSVLSIPPFVCFIYLNILFVVCIEI